MDGLLDMNSLEGEKIKKQNKLYLLIIIVLSVIILLCKASVFHCLINPKHLQLNLPTYNYV